MHESRLRNELHEWLAGLSQVDRLIVVLRYADGLEPWEIEDVLKIGEREVRQRMDRQRLDMDEIGRAAARVSRAWRPDPPSDRVQAPIGETIFTAGQVAAICGTCVRTVAKWCDAKLLPSYRLPMSRHLRIKREDLVKFMGAHKLPTQRPDLVQSAEIGSGA